MVYYDIDFMESEIEIILGAFSYTIDDSYFITEDNPYCSSEAINNVWNKIESNYLKGDFNYNLSSNELTTISIVLGNYEPYNFNSSNWYYLLVLILYMVILGFLSSIITQKKR